MKESRLLPLAEWHRLMKAIEELDDIRAYDRAKAQPDSVLPFEEAVREIRGRRGR